MRRFLSTLPQRRPKCHPSFSASPYDRILLIGIARLSTEARSVSQTHELPPLTYTPSPRSKAKNNPAPPASSPKKPKRKSRQSLAPSSKKSLAKASKHPAPECTRDKLAGRYTARTAKRYNLPYSYSDSCALKNSSFKDFINKHYFSKLEFVKSDEQRISRQRAPFVFRATIRTCYGDSLQITGDGVNAKDAQRAAVLHMHCLLHETGLLQQFTEIPVQEQAPSGQLLNVQMVKLYNYAAFFGTLPNITTYQPPMKDTLQRAMGYQLDSMYETRIEFEKEGIVGIGLGTSKFRAEHAASLHLEGQLKTYFAKHDQSPQTDDPHTLNSLTTEKFRNYLRNESGRFLRVTAKSAEQDSSLRDEGRHGQSHDYWVAETDVDNLKLGPKVYMPSEASAKSLALLTGAIAWCQRNEGFKDNFESALRDSNGNIMQAARPVILEPRVDLLSAMQDMSRKLERAGALDKVARDDQTLARKRRHQTEGGFKEDANRSKQLRDRLKLYREADFASEMRTKRASLPISQYHSQITAMVSDSPHSIVVGATGSGKTTQVPQIILESATEAGSGASCNIFCTQPRRIAAISVAQRVSEERHEIYQTTVGHHVRFDYKPPKERGSILFGTTGILLKQLQENPDSVFDRFSHIVLDEVHERDMTLDFLLVVLKKSLQKRQEMNKPVPKLVLMSATLDTELFANYFKIPNSAGEMIPCPSINVPGRLFPVREQYLRETHDLLTSTYTAAHRNDVRRLLQTDDSTRRYMNSENDFAQQETQTRAQTDRIQVNELANLIPKGLVAATIAHIAQRTQTGAILVFLPGKGESLDIQATLTAKPIFGIDFSDLTKFRVSVLNSETPLADQAYVFKPVPEGCRKVILATNIAETSVTIPDVEHVIDTGKMREMQYDAETRISALSCVWVSKANAKQRAGRAGRVQDGNYYGLYTKERLESFNVTPVPEILRADIQHICLTAKSSGFDGSIASILQGMMQPPKREDISIAVDRLKQLEALTPNEEMTALGRLLAALPVAPALGKMIIFGVIFRCLDPILILGALSVSRSLMMTPSGARKEWLTAHRLWLDGKGSEHIGEISAFKHLRRAFSELGDHRGWEFAKSNFLNVQAYKQIHSVASQIEEILVTHGLIPHTPPYARRKYWFGTPSLNENSLNVPLIKALALAGFAPNLAIHTRGHWFRSSISEQVMVHAKSLISSVSHSKDSDRARFNGAAFTYSVLSKSEGAGDVLQMNKLTEVTPLMILLFGGPMGRDLRGRNQLKIGQWLPLFVSSFSSEGERTPMAFTTIRRLREHVDLALTNSFFRMGQISVRNTDPNLGLQDKTYMSDDPISTILADDLAKIMKDENYEIKTEFKARGEENAKIQYTSSALRR